MQEDCRRERRNRWWIKVIRCSCRNKKIPGLIKTIWIGGKTQVNVKRRCDQ